MKAGELMIGDWVFVDKNFAQKYHKVRSISMEEGIRGTYVNDYGIECPSLLVSDTVKPILLTEEILKANGFIVHPSGTICNYKHHIISDEGLGLRFLDRDIKFKYVHELQHALRLCGLNELADNFKINN